VSQQSDFLLELVKRAKKGDERAFEKILKELEPDLRKKVNRFYIRGGDSSDVLQEARIGLWKAVQDFDEHGGMAFKYFAINLCVPRRLITQISSANRNKFKLQNEAHSLSTPVYLDTDDNEQTRADFIQDENSDMLDNIIIQEEFDQLTVNLCDKLTSLEKSVFEKYSEEDNYKSIAKSLKISSKAVDNSLMRIRKKAKEALVDFLQTEMDIYKQEYEFENSLEELDDYDDDYNENKP